MGDNTYGNRPRSCRFDIHPGAVVRHSFGVPGVLLARKSEWGCLVATYEFDSNLLVVQKIRPLKDDTKGPFTNLFPDSVVDTHYVG